MNETKLTVAEFQRMADALPANFAWGDTLNAYEIREILSAMGYFELVEAAKAVVERFGPTENDYIFSKRMAIQKARAALAKVLGDSE